jgi:hypothetical protein
VLALELGERVALGEASAKFVDELVHLAFVVARALRRNCGNTAMFPSRFHAVTLLAAVDGR